MRLQADSQKEQKQTQRVLSVEQQLQQLKVTYTQATNLILFC